MKRHLPLIQRIALYFRSSIQIGATILILGSWFCSSMINVEELSIEQQLQEVNTTAEGTIMKRWNVDWDDEGNVVSYGYDYYFIHPTLGQVSNTSFSNQPKGKAGDKVEVYYDVENPYVNKVVGMSYAESSPAILLLLLIPLIGIGFLAYGLSKVKAINHLLRNGTFIWGNFVKHEKTSVKINEEPQYRLYYNYKTLSGESYTRSFTTTKSSDFDNKEIVMYDQSRPERMILLYELSYTVANYIESNWEEVKKIL